MEQCQRCKARNLSVIWSYVEKMFLCYTCRLALDESDIIELED